MKKEKITITVITNPSSKIESLEKAMLIFDLAKSFGYDEKELGKIPFMELPIIVQDFEKLLYKHFHKPL